MKTIRLGATDLAVSALSLGTAQFGTGRSREEAREQMKLYMEAGGNFLDTAHVYGDWGCQEKGVSEIVIGEWLAGNQLRQETVIVTKGCHPPLGNMLQSRVSREDLAADVEGSLRNLKTDYIDLYLFHRDNPQVPVGELLESMEEHVKKGSLRYYGCSNWSLERIKEAEKYASENGLKGFVCNQMMFTLADVQQKALEGPQLTIPEDDFYQYHKEKQLGFMAYMCMAGGLFPKMMAGKELSPFQQGLYGEGGNKEIAGKLKELEAQGYTTADFTLAYVEKASFPSVPIVSFRNADQLKEALRASEKKVPEELLDELVSLKKHQIYRW